MSELDRKVTLNSIGDFETLKNAQRDSVSPNLFAGTIPSFVGEVPPQARRSEFGPTELCDADGEVVSIKDMNLIMAGAINDEPAEMKSEHMQDFVMAVMRTTTFNQRALPIRLKIVIMWRMFMELFFGSVYSSYQDIVPNDHVPYLVVAETWCRKQRVPAPFKERAKLYMRRVRDLFVFTPSSQRIDTYGLPGFQSYYKKAT